MEKKKKKTLSGFFLFSRLRYTLLYDIHILIFIPMKMIRNKFDLRSSEVKAMLYILHSRITILL